MVDLVLLQSVSYMAGAIGVCVAAFYYVMNLRETARNRKVSFANMLMQNMQSPEWQRNYMEALNMQWSDFEDFKRKYDSSVSEESYAKRMSVWANYDILGWQFRRGLVDIDSFTELWALGAVMSWYKFRSIVEGYRGWQYPKGTFRDWEYLAGVLEKKMMDEDPDFVKKLDTFFTTPPVNQ